ncbi:MAG: chemotaxis protein CheA [Spirochaetes bacterium]|nr:chemotaxis protein CheA [Spirochaetota bacterium]
MAVAGMDESKLRSAFLEEAEDLCAKLGETLLALEQSGGGREPLNEAFRLIHSLKSESALMGFTKLSELTHAMEDVLGLARDGRAILDRGVMDLLFAGADLIGEMLGAVSRGASDGGIVTEEVVRGLASVSKERSGKSPVSPSTGAPALASPPIPAGDASIGLGEFEMRQLAEARDRGEGLYRLVLRVDEGEPMKFPRVFLVFNALEEEANVVKAVPPLDGEPLDDALYGETVLYLTSGKGEEAIARASSVDQVAILSLERLEYSAMLVRASDAAPGAQTAAGRAAQASAADASPAIGAPPSEEAQSPAEVPPSAGSQQRRPGAEKTSIRVDTRKLDDLWSLIAELVIRKSRVARLSEKMGKGADVHEVREELAETFDSLDKIAGGMQQAMVDTRMIPISVIFSKFPRLVRDLSRKLGKSIELAISGEGTEIDRGIVEALSDPLTHIIRNSIDHGIESPDERVRQGKPARGRVSIDARQQGGNIVIELADDGRGIDTARIREKAVADGMPAAATMGESALLELVFLPGFSTREAVTDLSGRGVGMDVVATRVRGELKGDVALTTEKGRGTRVTLLLPLTLTIVNSLLVRGDGQLYAIPLTDIDSTVKVLNTEIRGENGREAWVYQGDEIPLHRLGVLFGRGRRRAEEHFAVILRHGDARGCLVVDELIEEQEIVIKPVDDLLNDRRLFSGVSLLEDGRLVFILDTSFIRREDF